MIRIAFEEVIDYLKELEEDNTIPRNIKMKISQIIKMLEEEGDSNIIKNRVMDELDDISNDTNLQSFTRTQIWHVVSMLENA